MKKQFLTCILIFTSFIKAASLDSLEEPLLLVLTPPSTDVTIRISPTSQAILHISYMTQHLLPIVKLINEQTMHSKKQEHLCVQRLVLFFSEPHLLKSSKMKTVFSHIKQTNSLQPLHLMWEQIKHFRYGINPTEKIILLDFSKICLIAYQAILSCNSSHKTTLEVLNFTPEDLDLLEIDQVFETLEKYSVLYFLRYSPLALVAVQRTTSPQTYTTDFCASFALRYYLKKRLQASFELFKSLHDRNVPIFLHGIENLGFKKEDLIFNDPVIAGYFSLLLEEKNLNPLLQVIGQFQSFDFIKSPTFTKEFLLLLCLVYKDTFTLRSTETFDELQELSIEQILTLIDTINEKYNTRISPYVHNPLTLAPSRPQIKITDLSSIDSLIKTEYKTTPESFTNMVFHRYYYIKRLEEVVKILLKFTTRESSSNPIKTSLLLKPIELIWQDFKAYRDICDQKIIEDFTKNIFILSHTILSSPENHHYAPLLHIFFHLESMPTTRLYKNLSQEQDALITDFKPWIEIDKVINRFYLLKRMEYVLEKLYLLNEQGLLCLSCNNSTNNEIDPCLQLLNITKEPILVMIQTLYRTHSFRPFFSFWNNINRYKYIQDEQIMKEFACFVTHLLHTTVTHHTSFHSHRMLIEKERLSLDQLQNMPLEDILNLLDILVEELPQFLEKNEIDTDMTWKEWFKKYWLLFPLSATIFLIKVYIISQVTLENTHNHTQPLSIPSNSIMP